MLFDSKNRFFLVLLTALPSLIPLSAWPAAALKNQLAANASPYLEMHANDPTAWQAWSGEAVAKARAQKKLLFVSVGYFSCHWCHVMQKESYQNKQIASFINQHFLPVKIDRETEPALDAHLIAFAERSQGYSGWPLNVFLTPDGYPLYAAVYLPPKEFLELLQKLQKLWIESPAELSKLAAAEQAGGNGPGASVAQHDLAKKLAAQVELVSVQLGSPLNGGFGDASKFPSAPQLDFLLDRVAIGTDKSLREFLDLTLTNMARYGLRDHLGGGFFRYTVDPGWKTPHFEKMLYDNAQLARIYMKASKVFHSDAYRQVAKSTLDFMQAEMLHARGAMVASFSAIDDRNVEGGYYLWDKQQVEKLLTMEEWQTYRLYAGMVDSSPLDEGYLPTQAVPVYELAAQLRRPEIDIRKLIASSEKKLLLHRKTRSLPRDGKLLAGWNGLALSAFSEAARDFSGEPAGKAYEKTSASIHRYLTTKLWNGNALVRASDKGKALGQSSLEDYAYAGLGLLHRAQVTGRSEDYKLAHSVILEAWRRFYTDKGWRLSEPGFIPMEAPMDVLADGAMYSPSAVVLDVSLRLADELNDKSLRTRALAALNSGAQLMSSDPFWYVTHIAAMARK